MISYVASPYTHPDPAVRAQRYVDALRYTGEMLALGNHVFSPIVYSHTMAVSQDLPIDWAFWRDVDLDMLSRCDELVVLMIDGWETSVGVRAEVEHAELLGIPVRQI